MSRKRSNDMVTIGGVRYVTIVSMSHGDKTTERRIRRFIRDNMDMDVTDTKTNKPDEIACARNVQSHVIRFNRGYGVAETFDVLAIIGAGTSYERTDGTRFIVHLPDTLTNDNGTLNPRGMALFNDNGIVWTNPRTVRAERKNTKTNA